MKINKLGTFHFLICGILAVTLLSSCGFLKKKNESQNPASPSISNVGSGRQTEAYKVAVDYDLPLEEAIKAGKYSYANEIIRTENFPATRKGKTTVDVILVDMGRATSTDEALAELERQGLRPATLPELLVLGSAYPDLQRTMIIVAFGSRWLNSDGFAKFPLLLGDDGGRFLDLHGRASGLRWDSGVRFLAVRK